MLISLNVVIATPYIYIYIYQSIKLYSLNVYSLKIVRFLLEWQRAHKLI